jgi:1,4-dihydroxy-6-naphthoate synthase
MQSISLGYSPCPNDTFIFYAMVYGKVISDNLNFNEVLLDVEALNQKAFKADLDVTKISYHAFGHLRDTYCLLRSGGALGRGCGPLVITNKYQSMEELQNKIIAIPGKLTTAYMLLQLYDPAFQFDASRILIMPFDKIMKAVATGEADAGLIIHESRFTYPSYGLKQVLDLGEWWESETGLPIPLGGIIAKRSLGGALINRINAILKSSIEYAFHNRHEPEQYIKQHSQEISDDVINQHINLYVNDFTLDAGVDGINAVNTFMTKAEESGIIPTSHHPLFIDS